MRILRYLLIPVIAAIICTLAPVCALAQIPGLSATPAANPGIFQTAPIIVDGYPVLHIAALTNPPPGAETLSSRQFTIDGAIAQVLAINPDNNDTIYNPQTFRVSIVRDDGQYELVATDDRHKSPLPILTVTADDARYANETDEQVAEQWRAALQSALTQALERRQPATLSRSRALILRNVLIQAVLTIIGLVLYRRLKNRAVAAGIAWLLAILWSVGITYGLLLFPATIEYGHFVIHAAINVVLIAITALIFDWLIGVALHQIVRAIARFGTPTAQARSLLRVPTMSRALDGFKRFLIVFIALLGVLSALKIPIASVVTIGGIAAVAVGFAAQSLVRDFLNGLLVLFEDQYVVGDYISIGAFNGVVEQFTLRVVQLRDIQGNLITIPHSSVMQVVNSSRNWSRIDYQVSIDATADARKAIDTLKATLNALKADDQWGDAVIQPYEWIGLEVVTKERSIVRAIVRTAPLRQYDLRRELNARVIESFSKAGVPLGADQATTLLTPMTQSPIPG